MANALVPISTITLTANATEVIFSNIPQDYRDLYLIVSAIHTGTLQAIRMQFNLATSTYTYVGAYGTGSSAVSNGSTQNGIFIGDIDSSVRGNSVVSIFDYSKTDRQKTILSRTNLSNDMVGMIAGRWDGTAAITSLKMFVPDSSSMGTTSTFELFGVLA